MFAIPRSTPSPTVSLRNVALLSLLGMLAAFTLSSTVLLGVSLIADYLPGADTSVPFIGVRLASIPLLQLAYFGFCLFLARGKSLPMPATLRYACLLQLQAALEILGLIVTCLAIAGGMYLLMGMLGDTETQASMRHSLESGDVLLTVFLFLLATPAASIVVASVRMHILSRRPGALAATIDGSLPVRHLVVHADATDTQNELVRRLERLTSAEIPGLGRLMYGSHPRLTMQKSGELSAHALTWWTCPMQLRIALHPLDSGVQELRIHCQLRRGLYRLYLIPTPADVSAQMQYIENNLVQPFVAELERRSAQRQHDALRDQAIEAQLRILQAQIEPHFLFNTLANVRQLYRTSNTDGESMLDHLIAYLRCAMDDLRAEHSSVVKEMDLAMHYLAIMQIRMGERLAYRFSVPETLLAHPMPPAMLISLVENAIKHGIANSRHGEIVLSAASDGAVVRVGVTDNGAGFSSVGGTGVGLSNIRQRLEAIYGTRAWLEVGVPEQGGFTATIVIPFEGRK